MLYPYWERPGIGARLFRLRSVYLLVCDLRRQTSMYFCSKMAGMSDARAGVFATKSIRCPIKAVPGFGCWSLHQDWTDRRASLPDGVRLSSNTFQSTSCCGDCGEPLHFSVTIKLRVLSARGISRGTTNQEGPCEPQRLWL